MERDRSIEAGRYAAGAAGAGDLFLDAFAARIAFTQRGCWASNGVALPGHDDRRDEIVIRPIDGFAPLGVTLVVLTRAGDDGIDQLIESHGPAFDALCIVTDRAPSAASRSADQRIEWIDHPLDADFAKQRNVAQQALRTPWAFHLDTDETIDPALLHRVRSLASCADRDGLRAIGVPRTNMVDGVKSELYPDFQYRLVHSSVRFEGRVHERPDACRDWPTTSLYLEGGLTHRLTAERVRSRHETYAAMGQERARSDDLEQLLTPFGTVSIRHRKPA